MDLPSGFVALLLTDVEGSTAAWDADASAMEEAMALHDQIVAEVVASAGGVLLKSKGEGDSTFSVFADPVAAVVAAGNSLAELSRRGFALAVRASVHAGDVEPRGGDYFGPVPNRAARVRGLAKGGQIVVTEAVASTVANRLPGGLALVDLGTHELRGLSRPEHVFGLAHPALGGVEPIEEPPPPPGNLPAPIDRFVGRDEERIMLDKALRQHRLVTVVGPGGIGKSRLALQVAAEQADDRAAGTWIADLSDLDGPEQVATTVAAAVGVEIETTALDAIADALTRPALVVLDTCEAQLDGAAEFAEQLLARAPSVVIMATSREPLDARGEAILRVEPLDVDSGARELFLTRATAANLTGTELDAALVERICVATDGIPLAIELVAGRLAVEPIEELVAALDHLEPLLGADAARRRTGPARQRTLTETIRWSIEPLPANARAVLTRLTVFAGGWPDGAPERVCADDELTASNVSGALVELRRRSLVVNDRDNHDRHRLLDTVRQYVEQSEPARPASIDDAHLRWASELARELGDGAAVPGATRVAFLADRANFRAAFAHACASGNASRAQAMIYSQANPWIALGVTEEGLTAAERALDLGPSPERAAALVAIAFLEMMTGNFDAAARHHEECLAQPDVPAEVRCDVFNGNVMIAFERGLPESEVVAIAERAVAECRSAGFNAGLAVALNNLAIMLEDEHLDRRLGVAAEAAETERRVDVFAVNARVNYAHLCVVALNLETAEEVLHEVEHLNGDARIEWWWWLTFGFLAFARDDAAAHRDAVIAHNAVVERNPPPEFDARFTLSFAEQALDFGDHDGARALLDLVLARGLPDAFRETAEKIELCLEGIEAPSDPDRLRTSIARERARGWALHERTQLRQLDNRTTEEQARLDELDSTTG